MAPIYSRTGDDGYTGLLGEGRVPKFHPQPEAYGSIDEASASLGLARALTQSEAVTAIVKQIQRDLYMLMAELASTPEHRETFHGIDGEKVSWLEHQVDAYSRGIEMPDEFVLPGDSTAGAAFDLARTVVRRAERAVARLHLEGDESFPFILQYLNRLSSLCFVLALWENQQAGVDRPSLAKDT